MPNELVKAVGLEAVIGLQRDKDAEPVTELKDGGDAHESPDSGDDQPRVADSVAVDRPTVEMIQMRRQPREHDCDDNQRNENPATGGIFPPAHSETAAPGKGVSDCAGQRQNDCAGTCRIGKESCPIPPAPNREREKRQRAADSKREILNDVIQNYGAKRRVIGSQLSVNGGMTMDYGLWTMDYGLWTMDYGLWTMDYGLWTMDYGLWTMDHGLWTTDNGTTDNGTTDYGESLNREPWIVKALERFFICFHA